jgi:hypothetical protein
MNTIELKSNIHKIVDEIQNEQFLKSLYDFLLVKESNTKSKFWSSLTETQKQDILTAYEESKNKKNLISREEFFKKR